jgi:hypothetical protein
MGIRPTGELGDGEGNGLAVDQIGAVYASVKLVADNIDILVLLATRIDDLDEAIAALDVVSGYVTTVQAAADAAALSATSAGDAATAAAASAASITTALSTVIVYRDQAAASETAAAAALAAALAAQAAAEAARDSAEEIVGGPYVLVSAVGVADGVAGLDSGGKVPSSQIAVAWGELGGTLADQTDLVAALDDKADLAGATFTGPVGVPADDYGVDWDGKQEAAPKDAVYDQIEALTTAMETAIGDRALSSDVASALALKISITAADAAYAAIGHSHSNAAGPSTAGFMSGADKAKLDGIAAGATANDTDANLKNRANHTGSQAISTVTSLQATLDAKAAKFTTIGSQSTNKTAATADHDSHIVFSGTSRTLTLGSVPADGTSFSGRFTTAWSVAVAGGCSKNGAATSGVTTASIAAGSLVSFFHEGGGVWIISGNGVT